MLKPSVVAISLSFLHLLARVARVSEVDSGAMPTPRSVKMSGALDAACRLQVVLDKFLGDPWAREALSGLQARLAQVDALAEDVAEYVNNQFVTRMDAMASLTPALAPPEAQPEAPDNSAMRHCHRGRTRGTRRLSLWWSQQSAQRWLYCFSAVTLR